jgi:peptidoglycan hydrolase-like protein with peptidoglycan-binding domain
LNRLSYFNGPPDGVMGPATSNAIATYERSNGLPIDGQPSPQLLARLQSTPTGAGSASY